MDIVEFLTARLDEDEAMAKSPWGLDWHVIGQPGRLGVSDADAGEPLILDTIDDGTAYYCKHFQPRRMLAEIAAKREILNLYRSERAIADKLGAEGESRMWLLQSILEDLAGPYADHPNYGDMTHS